MLESSLERLLSVQTEEIVEEVKESGSYLHIFGPWNPIIYSNRYLLYQRLKEVRIETIELSVSASLYLSDTLSESARNHCICSTKEVLPDIVKQANLEYEIGVHFDMLANLISMSAENPEFSNFAFEALFPDAFPQNPVRDVEELRQFIKNSAVQIEQGIKYDGLCVNIFGKWSGPLVEKSNQELLIGELSKLGIETAIISEYAHVYFPVTFSSEEKIRVILFATEKLPLYLQQSIVDAYLRTLFSKRGEKGPFGPNIAFNHHNDE